MPADRIDAIVSLAKRRGFVFPSSEIYGGTRSAWDYGPLGVELKENVRRQWWRSMVQQRDDIVGLDSAVILARDVWVASGHLDAFVDPLTECQSCHKRFRADHLEEAYEAKHGKPPRLAAGPQLPQLRQQGHLHRAADVQRPDEDLPRPGRERGGPALPAARDRAGHLRQLQQRRRPRRARSRRSASRRSARASATRSRRATSSSGPASSSRWRWSSSSSRAPTRSGTSTGCSERWNWYVDLGLTRGEPALLRAPEGEAVALLEAHRRHRVPLPVRRHRVLRARGHRQPHRLRPDHALQALRRRPVLLRPGEERALGAVRHRAGGRPDPRGAGVPARGVRRGRGAQHQGRRGQAHGDALRPAAGAGQGGGAAAVAQRGALAEGARPGRRRCASAGSSSSTTPRRSAAATAGRTRSARRSASRSTSTRSTTTR